MFKTTSQVAKELGVPVARLKYQVTSGKVTGLIRDERNCLKWTSEDVAQAKLALATDKRKKI